MTQSAWIFMLSVWGFTLFMTIYCFAKLLSSKQFTDPELEADEDRTPPFVPPEDRK